MAQVDVWPESEIQKPLRDDNITPPEANRQPWVIDANRIEPYASFCQRPIPSEVGSSRNKWLHRCYTHSVSGRVGRIEAISFMSQGNMNWDAQTIPMREGQRFWRWGRMNLSRQGTNMWVTDAASDEYTEDLDSIFYFFPRKNLPALRASVGSELEVILPTGESVFFDAATRKIKRGALSELSYVDLNPNARLRSFANIAYSGSGIMIRGNHKAADPRVWDPKVRNYSEISSPSQGKKCFIDPRQLFAQEDWTDIKFKTDDEFAEFLKSAVDVISGQPCGIVF